MPRKSVPRRPRWQPRLTSCARAACRTKTSGASSKRSWLRRVNAVSNDLAIETVDLWKRYDDVEALRGLDLQVPAGSICGFLGRNGAGKTTTIKVLLGMARATKGEARIFGAAAGADARGAVVRQRIGFVSDEKDLYDYMTVGEIIAFTRSFFPKWRRDLEQK